MLASPVMKNSPHPLVEQLKGKLPKGAYVLDLGCGDGHNLRWAKRQGWNVEGVDRIKQKDKFIDQANIEDISIVPDSHDAIIAINSLQFLKSSQAVKREIEHIYNGLKPGGYLVLAMFGHHAEWQHLVLFSPQKLRYFLNGLGFKVIEYRENERLDVPKAGGKKVWFHRLIYLLQKPK